jgi:hypothetical protein
MAKRAIGWPGWLMPDQHGFHRTRVKEAILLNGWNPELKNNSNYGTAAYLSDEKWDLDDFFLDTVGHSGAIDLEIFKSPLKEIEMFACVPQVSRPQLTSV